MKRARPGNRSRRSVRTCDQRETGPGPPVELADSLRSKVVSTLIRASSLKENQPAARNAVRSKERGTTMRIERRNTTQGQSPYAGIDFRLTTSEIRNPDGSIVFRLENVEVPEFWSQVASDVLAQKYFRKAGVAARLKKVEEETVPSWLWRSVPDTEALAALPEAERYRQRTLRQAGVRPPRRLLDLLGLEGQLFLHAKKTRSAFYRRAALHAGQADGRAELAAVVQHRPALGLRRRWPRPGPLLRRPLHRQADQVEVVLRASAAARLLHPGRR